MFFRERRPGQCPSTIDAIQDDRGPHTGRGCPGGRNAVPADPGGSGCPGGWVVAGSAYGVLIKGAKPLEALAGIHTLILDKTGTLTDGRPQIVSIDTQEDMPQDQVLYFAASPRTGIQTSDGARDRDVSA